VVTWRSCPTWRSKSVKPGAKQSRWPILPGFHSLMTNRIRF
jgi:hypothetical protein